MLEDSSPTTDTSTHVPSPTTPPEDLDALSLETAKKLRQQFLKQTLENSYREPNGTHKLMESLAIVQSVIERMESPGTPDAPTEGRYMNVTLGEIVRSIGPQLAERLAERVIDRAVTARTSRPKKTASPSVVNTKRKARRGA